MHSSPLLILLAVFLGTGLLSACQSTAPTTSTTVDNSVRVMSFNIRYNNPDDGQHAWPHRKDRVADLIRFHQADLLGVQEALKGQLDDLSERLPNHDWFGVGRSGSADGGEFSAIFYRTDRFELLEHDTFWLSPTPEEPGSQGWDAALPRIVTWGKFKDQTTGQEFYHFNTHFDHRGETARLESAKLVTQKVETVAGDQPAVVTGDFNLTPDTKAYDVLTASLEDSYHSSKSGHYGPESTFYGFELDADIGRIDYIFTRNNVQVLRQGTLADNWKGNFPSDHLPVVADVVFE